MESKSSSVDDAKREVLDSLWSVRQEGAIGGLMSFNADYGYIEAILRGFRSGFLKSFEYRQLCQCESLEDIKLTMGDTDYLNVLQNQAKLTPEIVLKKCEDKFINEFAFLQSQATGKMKQLTSLHLILCYSHILLFVCFSLVLRSIVNFLRIFNL
jgi:hypothetical protein